MAIVTPNCPPSCDADPMCRSQITLSDVTRLTVGQSVLIIQMQGAEMNITDTAAFGTITDYNGAGLYEFAVIESISGTMVTLRSTLTNSTLANQYDPAGLVQLVGIPTLTDVVVTGTLTGLPWNSNTSTGGVIAVDAANSITLNADIDASELGYQGFDGVSGPSSVAAYGYVYPAGSSLSSRKGSGIVIDDLSRTFGRGANANGGGGGNDHNSGGGGGGNYGAGGRGGDGWVQGAPIGAPGTLNYQTGGVGGKSLQDAPAPARLFLGGAGGAGDANNNHISRAASGGGIVILNTPTLVGNNYNVISNGGASPQTTGIDGGGGGGAGG
ncbi:MAG: hypothetical protein F6K19_36700, partial [Cyanothece sp. SIO1E1]|nr:hypothetical protein [Cyanothece sp. SIO1E1]